MTDKDLLETLENLMDKHGLGNILIALGDICDGKAEHLRCNWQNEGMAKDWDKAAWVCITAEGKVMV